MYKLSLCKWLVFLLYIFFATGIQAQKVISIAEYGIHPGDGSNVIPAIQAAIQGNRKAAVLTLSFPKGRYDFYPVPSMNPARGFDLSGLHHITIEGNGSSFIFHSQIAPFWVNGCSDITLQDFSIDWDRPYISQGQIVAATDEYVDLRIDRQVYPFVIEQRKLLFTGEGWQLGVALHNLYDKDKKEIVYHTLDDPMGVNFFTAPAEEISDGIVRFHTHSDFRPEAGDYVSMLHARYLSPAIQLNNSRDIHLHHIRVFHALGMGVIGFKCENVQLDDVNVMANEKKDRVFSAIADAFHFSTCKGMIQVDHCTNTGQADDFINIHGEYVRVAAFSDAHTLITPQKGKLRDVNALLAKGEEIWLVDSNTTQRIGPYTIQQLKPGDQFKGYTLSLNKPLPIDTGHQYYIENKTWSPSVEIRNCRILKKNRARGILVTTPGKVIIEHNYFSTAGAAILIEGDLTYWFESGAVGNVIIRNNVFENCVSSGQYWGKAVITISPYHQPTGNESLTYHTGIRITDNVFKHFDAAVLFARSVQNIQFVHNELVRTHAYIPFSGLSTFTFDGCKSITIAGNTIAADFLGKDIRLLHMKAAELVLNNPELHFCLPQSH